MTPRAALLLLGLLAAAAAPARAALDLDGPVLDFRLPVFDPATGRKISDLHGAKAFMVKPGGEVSEFQDFTLTIYRREGPGHQIEIQSPKAMLFTKQSLAVGNSPLLVVGEGFRVTGEDWQWSGAESRVVIRQHARVVFTAALPSLLQ